MSSDNTFGAKRGAASATAQGVMPTTHPGVIPQHYLATQVANAHEATANLAGLAGHNTVDAGMNGIVNQLGGLGINGAAVGPNGAVPPVMSSYVTTADGQLLYPASYAPAGIPTYGYGQAPDATNAGFTAPYLGQGAFPAYVPYSYIPYTPGRAGIVSERSEAATKEVPGLENRRSSYSTNESTPATPFFGGSMASRDPASRVAVFDRSSYTTPSPQQYLGGVPNVSQHPKGLYSYPIVIDRDLDALLRRDPPIPTAVPAVFTPRKSMKTLEQSLVNNIPGNRNVYIRGLHPTTDDDLLLRYTERFGKVETSKAIIDTTTGACKGFGFAKFYDVRDSEACIRGFFRLGYEVGFARVTTPVTHPIYNSIFEPCDHTTPRLSNKFCCHKHAMLAMPNAPAVDHFGTNLCPPQESFNSRLKAEGDDESTNLYISNLPRHFSEAELGTVFLGYTILSSKILRDGMGNSRGVGFARFESREVCDRVIEEFQGLKLGPDGLPMQIRYADTPAQKELKRITSERRQFRTNEYNVGAYGTTMVGIGPTMYNQPGGYRRALTTASNASYTARTLPFSIGARGQGRGLTGGGQSEYAQPPNSPYLYNNDASSSY
ncbi:putative sporulation-specific protein [Rosellinia necatrix]|uniref:Putative sporulation-specific protein n=1 Tax=Rosellinia necatrix TaxID=77044 RepID=A0A1W2TED2_ROSNE|nr:putative sporulation-specific protein [Rosellinia necatrix]